MTTPLVLLPGLANDDALWSAQIDALTDIADASVGDTRRDDSLAGMAARVLAAAPDRFALAGLSMGGYLSFEIMRQAPGRVIRLALLDTSARPDTPEQTANRHKAIATMREKGLGTLTRDSLGTYLSDAAPDPVRDAVVAMAERIGEDAYVRQQHAIMTRPDSRPTLGGITVPTLVVVGEHDVPTPPAMAREIADGIAGAQLETIAGSGHLTAIEAPAAVSALLRAWLLG